MAADLTQLVQRLEVVASRLEASVAGAGIGSASMPGNSPFTPHFYPCYLSRRPIIQLFTLCYHSLLNFGITPLNLVNVGNARHMARPTYLQTNYRFFHGVYEPNLLSISSGV